MEERLPKPMHGNESPSNLPARLEPMMLTHLALSGDTAQYRQWRDRVEAILHSQAVADAPDTESREILSERQAWLQMRTVGSLGTAFGTGLALMWLSVFLPFFATHFGLAWWQVLPLLLPLPIAWRVGSHLWEDASLAGMRDVGKKPTIKRRLKALFRGLFRGYGAGFGFGFSLLSLQGLVSLLFGLNPSISLIEVLQGGIMGGAMAGTFGMLLAPMVARGAPSVEDDERPALTAPIRD